MKAYLNKSGNSGVIAYEYGDDWIRVKFEDGDVYEYTYASAGELDIEEMKRLADGGANLCSYINYNVRKCYSRKLPTGKHSKPDRLLRNRGGEVEWALKLFTSIKDSSKKWSCDKTLEIFTHLDEMYDFTGLDVTPLKEALLKHKSQILYDEDTLEEIIYHREETEIPRSRFWWYIDELIFQEIIERLESIDREFRSGELFSDFDFLDKNAVILNSGQSEELKLLLIAKRDFILWCDKNAMIRFREKENVPESHFWWWLDIL